MGLWDRIKKAATGIATTVKKAYQKVDVALGGRLPGGITPAQARAPAPTPAPRPAPRPPAPAPTKQVGAPVLKSTETKAIESFKEKGIEPEVVEVPEEIPEGRAVTDVNAEVELRSQGFMTVQTGVDETGHPITQIIPIQGFKEQSLEAQKAEAELAIDILLKGAAATPSAVVAVNKFVNSMRIARSNKAFVSKVTKKLAKEGIRPGGIAGARTGFPEIVEKIATNAKTIKQTKNILSTFFSKKALVVYGAWASAVTIGKWGFAEAAEGITFPTSKFLIPEAERTGDWTAVNEANALAEEITDISIWEKIALWTPLSPFIGIPKKIRGAAAGVEILNKYSEDQKVKQAQGETETQYWEKRREEEKEQDKMSVDYYNDERKKMVEWEREAEVAGRNADAKFWREQKEKQMKMEAEDRQAIAEFWMAYRKEAQKIAENNRPSNLNFGLL